MKSPFFFAWADEEMTLEEYGISIMAEGIPEIKEYTFVDLDGENGDELILQLFCRFFEFTLIL